jgi:hypothetical protein
MRILSNEDVNGMLNHTDGNLWHTRLTLGYLRSINKSLLTDYLSVFKSLDRANDN